MHSFNFCSSAQVNSNTAFALQYLPIVVWFKGFKNLYILVIGKDVLYATKFLVDGNLIFLFRILVSPAVILYSCVQLPPIIKCSINIWELFTTIVSLFNSFWINLFLIRFSATFFQVYKQWKTSTCSNISVSKILQAFSQTSLRHVFHTFPPYFVFWMFPPIFLSAIWFWSKLFIQSAR